MWENKLAEYFDSTLLKMSSIIH